MNLFSVSENKTTVSEQTDEADNNQCHIVMVSLRKKLLNDLASILSMHNMTSFKVEQQSFFLLQDDSITQNANVIIIDIADTTDVSLITEKMGFIVPMYAKCIFVGDTDSIAFSQEIARRGAVYLHVATQLWELSDVIMSLSNDVAYTEQRSTVKISVLGCKGGIGTSLISYQLLEAFDDLTSVPTLLVQGATGSADLDLIMDKPFAQKDGQIHAISESQSIRIEQRDAALRYDDSQYKLFNIILLDHGVHTLAREKLEIIFNGSQTLILIVSHELASLRVAKMIIDENKRGNVAGNSVVQRILVCLNEFKPNQEKMLTEREIVEYLGRKIDLVIPYQSKKNNSSKNKQFNFPEFTQFAAKILGKAGSEKELTSSTSGKKFNLKSLFNK
jgi:pilus assembly protein CpaE